MSRRHTAVLAGLGLAVSMTAPALPCTTVCLLERGKTVVAYNYDFEPSQGLALVNKRGMTKRSMLPNQGASWTAIYGSVTFNQFGRDNPTTGVNEKGLMASLMWLDETRYPPTDDRPAIGILEWIQYNLDRHAGVAEVIAHAEALRPTSQVPIHYLFADAGGDAAAVEFLEGRLVVHRGASMPVKALANSTYVDSLAAVDAARRRSGVPTTSSSLDRFVRAASLAGRGDSDPIARGFAILAAVAQPDFTRWSIVYDLGAGEVHFRTDTNRAIRRFALAGFDFSCAAPVKLLDVTAGGAGDVGAAFADYSLAANRALIEATFTKTPFLQGIPAAARDAAAAHPEATSSCAAAN
jgi:penicillin V acylase-like amidase (Ntn superfamily)